MSTEPSGEVIPFAQRDDEPQTIPVDRPPTVEEVLIGRVIRSAAAERRPIVPGWLRSRADFWSAVRRVAMLQAHRLLRSNLSRRTVSFSAGFSLASLVISGIVTTAVIAVFIRLRRKHAPAVTAAESAGL